MVHAEKNLIYNATSHGVCLKNSTVYIYGLPCCSECFKGLIQVGIIRVVCPILLKFMVTNGRMDVILQKIVWLMLVLKLMNTTCMNFLINSF